MTKVEKAMKWACDCQPMKYYPRLQLKRLEKMGEDEKEAVRDWFSLKSVDDLDCKYYVQINMTFGRDEVMKIVGSNTADAAIRKAFSLALHECASNPKRFDAMLSFCMDYVDSMYGRRGSYASLCNP